MQSYVKLWKPTLFVDLFKMHTLYITNFRKHNLRGGVLKGEIVWLILLDNHIVVNLTRLLVTVPYSIYRVVLALFELYSSSSFWLFWDLLTKAYLK